MHEGEVELSARQVRALLAAQMPDLAPFPLRRVGAGGTDHVLYRVGPRLLARFPRLASAANQPLGEAAWLPALAPCLPLAVPGPLRLGEPGAGYPFAWSVGPWLPGRDAWSAPPWQAAEALAAFVAALRAAPVTPGAPARTGTLADRDAFLRSMIAEVRDEAEPATLTRLWDRCLALPRWNGPPVWVHADLHPLNLLTRRGRLVAVTDWGAFGAGDPAEDLLPAWAALDASGRDRFRAALRVDDGDWARGWAFAFSKAVMAVPYYRETNPRLRDMMRRMLVECLNDCAAGRVAL
ncbi:phosphotransferase [Neotabrizicola shimadae]|nr:phosphotransferase [Neotabrizicola shimadae]